MRRSAAAFVLTLVPVYGFGAVLVDGTRDAAYGSPAATQTVQTQFGDAMPPGNPGGSELDAAYLHIGDGRLFLLFTGNQEPNFNKLDVFVDSVAGGENMLNSTPEYGFFTGSSWISSNLGGLTFDTGIEIDYHIFSRWGSVSGPFEVDFVSRLGGASALVPGSAGAGANGVGLVSAGAIPAGAGGIGPNASGPALTHELQFAINDNNAAGVSGGIAAADQVAAAAVTTGMEFSIDLNDLGNPASGTTVSIAAMINNGDHNFLSNQVLGGLPAPQGNLGGDGNGGFTGDLSGVDFNNFAGQQFVSFAVPETLPGAAVEMTPAGGLPSAVTIDYTFEALGATETLSNLSAGDDLTAVFGTHGVDWTFTSISSVPAALANPGFNGSSDTELFNQAPTQSLAPTTSATITVTIQLLTIAAAVNDAFCNDIVFQVQNSNGLSLSDTSVGGNNPDPNGDGNPIEAGESCFDTSEVPVTLMSLSVD